MYLELKCSYLPQEIWYARYIPDGRRERCRDARLSTGHCDSHVSRAHRSTIVTFTVILYIVEVLVRVLKAFTAAFSD